MRVVIYCIPRTTPTALAVFDDEDCENERTKEHTFFAVLFRKLAVVSETFQVDSKIGKDVSCRFSAHVCSRILRSRGPTAAISEMVFFCAMEKKTER